MIVLPLKYRARIEYKSVTGQDAAGQDVFTWKPLGVYYVGLEDEMLSRSEAVRQEMVISTNRTRMQTNFGLAITSAMRAIINRTAATTYQIVAGPAVIGDKMRLEFTLELVSTDNA